MYAICSELSGAINSALILHCRVIVIDSICIARAGGTGLRPLHHSLTVALDTQSNLASALALPMTLQAALIRSFSFFIA